MEAEQPEALRTRVPFRTVLASIVGLWLCYFVLTTLRSELLDLGFTVELMGRRALVSIAGVAITLGVWLVLRLFDSRPMWMKIAAALLLSLPAAPLIVKSNDLAFTGMQEKVNQRITARSEGRIYPDSGGDLLGSDPLTGGDSEGGAAVAVERVKLSPWHDLVEAAFGRYFIMLAWCALYLALLTGERARAAERREGAYKRAAKAAELRSLRYQVNPHFLFNTLNSLSAMVLTGKTQAAERMIQQLSTFYRRSLADDPTADVPLSEEFALQKLYLDIEAARFPHRLRACYELPPALADARVPGMILQPLVENSVKYAVAATSRRITITLSAREEYGRVVVTVSDDGDGGHHGEADKRGGHGIGLVNVRDRIEARFGSDATIVSGPVPGGYSTQLRLPIMRQPDNGE